MEERIKKYDEVKAHQETQRSRKWLETKAINLELSKQRSQEKIDKQRSEAENDHLRVLRDLEEAHKFKKLEREK